MEKNFKYVSLLVFSSPSTLLDELRHIYNQCSYTDDIYVLSGAEPNHWQVSSVNADEACIVITDILLERMLHGSISDCSSLSFEFIHDYFKMRIQEGIDIPCFMYIVTDKFLSKHRKVNDAYNEIARHFRYYYPFDDYD